MSVDQGFGAMHAQRQLLVAAVDKVIRELLAGRGLPFVILVGDEKMGRVTITTNCTALQQTLPMLVAATDSVKNISGKIVGEHSILVPPPGTKLS